ncbi:hypothetical protein ABZX40_16040 [Streptomyces sp. NPDC004610]|uniref:hypothetical protein n=1 Tax=unclassified Streptomyces TaxID=2593676 RepID=UPI0033A3ECF0
MTPRSDSGWRRAWSRRRRGRTTTRAWQQRERRGQGGGAAGARPDGLSGRISGLRIWFATVIAAALAAMLGNWIIATPGVLFDVPEVQDGLRPGPELSVSVEKVQLDDEGLSKVTREDHRPDARLAALMARPNAVTAPAFDEALRAVGGVNLETLTIRTVFTSRRSQQINIVDIQPEILERTAPWSGSLFSAPSQAGAPTMNLMLDMDRPRPQARDAVFDNSTGKMEPGKPFFAQRTITLRDGKQQVVLVRARTLRHYVSFRLRVTYLLGDDRRTVTVDDKGRPFELTAFSGDADYLKPEYRRIFTLQGDFSLCQTTPPAATPCPDDEP